MLDQLLVGPARNGALHPKTRCVTTFAIFSRSEFPAARAKLMHATTWPRAADVAGGLPRNRVTFTRTEAIMRRALISLLLPLALAGAACATDSPAGPDESALDGNLAVVQPKPRPAGGSCVTTVTPAGFAFPSLTIAIDGVCNLRHLGRATMHAIQIIDLSTGLYAGRSRPSRKTSSAARSNWRRSAKPDHRYVT